MKKILCLVLLSGAFICINSASAALLTVSDSVTVTAVPITLSDGTTTTVVPVDGNGNIDTSGYTPPQGPLNPTNGNTWQYGIRERNASQQATQGDRRAYSFLQFSTSAVTLADVQDPNFTAIFEVDYQGHLNNLNAGFDVDLGQVTAGAWDSTTTLPTDVFSTGATSLGNLVTNAADFPVGNGGAAVPGLTLDITSLVTGWVDGSIPNQGLTFHSTTLVPQSAYFSNATITTAVPEPSSVAIVSLAICGLAYLRKRR